MLYVALEVLGFVLIVAAATLVSPALGMAVAGAILVAVGFVNEDG